MPTQVLYALRERAKIVSRSAPQPKPKKNFAQFPMESPLSESGLEAGEAKGFTVAHRFVSRNQPTA